MSYFRPYIYTNQFGLTTFYKPLSWLKSFKELKGRIARRTMQLEDYNWQSQHRFGRENVIVGALSRDHPVQSTEKQGELECSEIVFLPNFQDDIRRKRKPVISVGITRYAQELRQLQEADTLLSLVMIDFSRRRQVPTQWAKNRR